MAMVYLDEIEFTITNRINSSNNSTDKLVNVYFSVAESTTILEEMSLLLPSFS